AEVGVGLRPERPRPRVIEEEEALRARADEEPSRMREHAVDRLPGELLPPRYRHEAVPLQPLQSHVLLADVEGAVHDERLVEPGVRGPDPHAPAVPPD